MANKPAPAENKMGVMPVGKLLANMAVPMMISMLVQALYNVVDSVFVARISENALTAVSLAFPLQNLMFSIILGAGLFGFWGMLLGVPVFVVIYTVINNAVERRLRRGDLPVEVEEYRDLDHIDAVTRESIKKLPDESAEEQ